MSLLFILMAPAILCVIFGWRAWVSAAQELLPGWRRELVFFGLVASSLGLSLELVFLGHGYVGPRSFQGPPIGFWLFIGRANGLIWLFVLLASALGKGKTRIALFLYLATSLLADYIFINAAMD